MNTELRQRIKSLSFVILIFIGIVLLINTNNNPNAIIQGIFRPIYIGTGRIYYAGIIPLLLVYYSLKQLYKQNNYTFLNTCFKRIIILILILSIIPTCSQHGLKIYKSFYSDLNSIYCYRNNMNLSSQAEENKPQVMCTLELQNCSSEKVEFYVKVNVPRYFKEVKEFTLVNTDTVFVLNAHERRQFEITFVEGNVNNISTTFSSINDFGFSLYNDAQEVKFTQSDESL